MEQNRFTRKQKLILGVMAVALVGVLVALGRLVSQDAPASPLATVVVPLSRTPVAVTAQASATSTPVSPAVASPTPTRAGVAAEVLAARRIETLTAGVGQVRELPKQLEIPLNFLSAQETGTYLRRIRADAERQAFVQRQQALLAALDLSPDLGQAFPPTVQTRVKQLVAFYDPGEAQIFISSTGLVDPPDISLVHQYAHALIDQHFSLSALTTQLSNADATRARDALMEGDATAVLAMHLFSGVEQADLGELADHLSEVELTDYEGYLSSRAMRDVFLFPYREGARFVAALLQVGWWPAVNAAYLDPPVSTEQILHPEKYVDTPRDAPRTVWLPDLGEGLGEDWRLMGQDVLGELILRAHLDQYLLSTPEAQAAAAGWDGDLAAVWHDVSSEPPVGATGDQINREVLVMRSLWDSADEAEEFVRGYVTLIDRRLRGASRVLRPGMPSGGRWWRGQGGSAFLQRKGDAVLVIWAPDTDTMEQILEVFEGE